MVDKVEGATTECKSCGQLTVCRKITYDGKDKLQWQDQNENKAHYSYDFKTKKVSCKHTPKSEEAPKSQQQTNIQNTSSDDPTPEQFLELGKALLLVDVV